MMILATAERNIPQQNRLLGPTRSIFLYQFGNEFSDQLFAVWRVDPDITVPSMPQTRRAIAFDSAASA
jgi:hypothetical protein